VSKLKANKSKYLTQLTFLSSISRNSLNSKYAYEHGLAYFQRFLDHKHPKYNLETILKPLSKDEMNVYELLDNFISYLLSFNSNLTPTSPRKIVRAAYEYLFVRSHNVGSHNMLIFPWSFFHPAILAL
jgi:hypothetical protein